MIGLYFSGTGNTRFCLEAYLSTLDKTAKLYPIESKEAIEQLEKADTIILAYPIYYSNLPKIVHDFLCGNSSSWKNKKVFILTTMGLFSGDGAGCAARLLKTYHAQILGGLHVKMPDSISDEKALKKPLVKNQAIVQAAKVRCKEAGIAHKKGKPYQQGLSFPSHIAGLLGQRLWFYNKTKNYTDKLTIQSNACIGCGLCASLCPMKNIEIIQKKAIANDQCTMCYRCINHCPAQAITLLGKKIHEQSLIENYLSDR